MFTKEEKDGCALLKIKEALSVYEVSDLRKEFIECFEAYDGVILELSEVTECDTAGVQLLCSARLTANNESKTFIIQKPSEPVVDAVVCAGLNPEKIINFRQEES